MILVSLWALGLGTGDLVRWAPEAVTFRRATSALAAALAATSVVTATSGFSPNGVLLCEIAVALVVGVWFWVDSPRFNKPGPAMAWLLASLLAAVSCSSLAQRISGPLKDWYTRLDFGFVAHVRVDTFVLSVAVALFSLASANRVVRLVLEATDTKAEANEQTLKGGRILGPMERIFVGAMILSGSLTALGALIAAKGVLRLPEIRKDGQQSDGSPDQVTEYFLIGTFTSLLIASGLALLVLASS
jgi:hypothetical protein